MARHRQDDSLCAAALGGRLSAADRARHLVDCESCMSAAMQAAVAGRAPNGPPRFVDPAVVWAHARERRRIDAEARITRILTAAQIAAGLVVLIPLGFLIGLPTAWPSFELIRQLPWPVIGLGLGGTALAGTGVAVLISQDAR